MIRFLLLVALLGCGEKKQTNDQRVSSGSGPQLKGEITYNESSAPVLTDARMESLIKAWQDHISLAHAADKIGTVDDPSQLDAKSNAFAQQFGFKDMAEYELVDGRVVEIAAELMAAGVIGKLETSVDHKLADKFDFSFSRADIEMVRKYKDRLKPLLEKALKPASQ